MREPQKAKKTEPSSIEPAPCPGPRYDPMDRIVQDLQNIQSFLAHLEQYPKDLHYVDTHLSKILELRRTIAHQLDQLAEEPYAYPMPRLHLLKEENERIFLYIEGVIGAMNPFHPTELRRFLAACEKTISKFDGDLTP